MSTVLPELSHEIIVDILSRLPLKPLFRFKCVCTTWLSLISNDPEFAQKHLGHAKHDTTVNRYKLFLSTSPFQSIDHHAFCNGDNTVTRELSYPNTAIQAADVHNLIGSCNGLIALSDLNLDICIFVWNPTTGDSRALPPADSSMSDQVFSGFGYDSSLDDYKVVRGVASRGSEVRLEIFNLKANAWRAINDLKSSIPLNGLSISLNGFLHWLVRIGSYPNQKLGIVSFDLAEEKFMETVEVPDDFTQKYGANSLKIRRVGENLCVDTDYYGRYCEGWIMKRDGMEVSWRRWYSFRSNPLPRFTQWLEVISVANNGNIILDVDGRELVVYDPEEQRWVEYGINQNEFQAIIYMETLVSPYSI